MLQEFEFTTKMMGCTLDVSIIAEASEESAVDASYAQMLALGNMYEKTFSRFLPESELSLLNTKAGEAVQVSPLFAKVFSEAQRIVQDTKGKCNPLLQISLLGYTKTFKELQAESVAESEIAHTAYNSNFDAIIFDAKKRVITLQENQKLDFGSFLKGYVAEKMSSLCSAYSGVIVNLGGDIYTDGFDTDGDVFEFNIYNPITKEDEHTLSVQGSALATSGNYKRVWEQGSTTYSHIVDPQSKHNPITDLVSATVIHKYGAYADAYATMAMTLSMNDAQSFLSKKECAYVLINQKGESLINLL